MEIFKLFATLGLKDDGFSKGVETAGKSGKSLSDAVASTTAKVNDIGGALNKSGLAAETTANRIKVLEASYSDSRKRVEELAVALNKSIKEKGADSDETRKLARELDGAESETKRFRDQLNEANGVLKYTGGTLDETSEKSEGFGAKIGSVMAGIGKGVAVAAAAIGTAAIAIGTFAFKSASSIEEANALIRRSSGATGEEFESLKESLKNVFAGVPESAETVAEVLAKLNTSTGLYGEDLEQLTDLTLKYARVNNEDAGASADTLGRLMNALDKDASELALVMDQLTAASQMSGIGVNNLSEYIIAAGPSFEEMGFGVERSIALFSSFYKAGAEPRELLSSLNILLNKMANEGLTDAEAAFNDLLAEIKDAPDILSATTIASEMFGARVGAKVADDIRAGRFEIDEWVDALQNAEGALASTAKESETFSDKLDKFKNKVTLALEPLGSEILGTLSGALDAAFDVDAPGGIIENIGAIVNNVIGVIAEKVPEFAQTAVSMVDSLLQGITTALPLLVSGVFPIVPTIIETILSMLPDVLQAAVDIVLTLKGGLTETIPGLIPVAVKAVLALVTGLLNNIPLLIDAALQLVVGLVSGIINAIPVIIKAVPAIYTALTTALMEGLPLIMQAGIDLFSAIVEGIPEILDSISGVIPTILDSAVEMLLNNMPEFVQTWVTLLSTLYDALPDILPTVIEAAGELLENVINALVEYLPEIIDAWIEIFSTLNEGENDILQSLITTLVNIITELVSAMLDNVPMLIETWITLFTTLVDAWPVIMIALVEVVSDLILTLVGTIIDNIPLMIETYIKLFVSIWSAMPQIIVQLVKAVPGIVMAIIDTIAGYYSKLAEVGANLIKGLWEGIKSMGGWLKEQVSGLMGGIIGGVKSLFGISSPSKVFAEIGENLGLGFINGVESMSGSIDRAMDDVFGGLDRDVSANINPSVGGVAIAASGGGVNQTVAMELNRGFAMISDTILDALPDKISLFLKEKEIAEGLFDALDEASARRGREFAPSRAQITAIARAAT